MNNALISPNEQIYSYDGTLLGVRIAQVEAVTFEVCPPLYWVECADDVNAQDWYFQTETNTCQLKPVEPTIEVPNIPPESVIDASETVS